MHTSEKNLSFSVGQYTHEFIVVKVVCRRFSLVPVGGYCIVVHAVQRG